MRTHRTEKWIFNAVSKSEALSFNVFPNPSNDVLQTSGILEFHQVELLNTNGQFVRQLEYGKINPTIDVKDLMPGIYVLRVVNSIDKGVELKKVLIQ